MSAQMDREVRWFDLDRFHAALKVVPRSPLRDIAMTCLEVHDEKAFTQVVLGDYASASSVNARNDVSQRIQDWQDRLKQLGFSRASDSNESPSDSSGRAVRLYSNRTTFTLAEMQSLVPGMVATDYKMIPLGNILHRPQLAAEMTADWTRFTEGVLAKEALGVWIPQVNSFDRPYAEARSIEAVHEEHLRRGPWPLLDDAAMNLLPRQLDQARYRENALLAFYAHLETALADGVPRDQLQQVDLPYALPLWVEKSGLIVAVRDVRFVPEVLTQPPQRYFGERFDRGLAVTRVREARIVETVYRDEWLAWRQWRESPDGVDGEALAGSLRRVLEADTAFSKRYPDVANGLDDLVGPSGVKPLGQWRREFELRRFAARAHRFLRDCSSEDIAATLTALEAGVQAQEAQQAKARAQEELRRVAQRVQSAVLEAAQSKVRHEDAGEKIGGARKDFHRRAMSLGDLEGLTDFERKSLVIKKNAWPPLDYSAMREAGIDPRAAVAIKMLKDSLAMEPDRSRRNHLGEDAEAEYVKAVGAVRDVMASVTTFEEFGRACQRLFDLGRTDHEGNLTNYIFGGTPLQCQWGSEVCNLLGEARTARVPYKIFRAVHKHVPKEDEWSYLIRSKRAKTDAEREADALYSEQERELHRPHLEVVERIGGEDWRGGRDITAQALVDHFGFRAIEFGNWLPQDERQSVLNMAFDSLCDLADALALPPRAISFGGQMAVAFGSRGRGGKNAALAHHEPGRHVINLTRMKGAGALAHEWWHGFDLQMRERRGYFTENAAPRFEGDPLPALVSRLTSRASTIAEVTQRSMDEAQRVKNNAASWCFDQSHDSRLKIRAALDEHFERTSTTMYKGAAGYLSGLAPQERDSASTRRALDRPAAMQAELLREAVGTIRGLCDKPAKFSRVCKTVEENLDVMLERLALLMTVKAAQDLNVSLDERFLAGANRRETAYFAQAKRLDTKRSEAYWSTPTELFARAGAQYVFYELASKGVRSDYLVYGADEERYLQHPRGNPNPEGIDRLALRELFAAVVEDYRTRFVRQFEADVAAEMDCSPSV
jgi:hypothetical protein